MLYTNIIQTLKKPDACSDYCTRKAFNHKDRENKTFQAKTIFMHYLSTNTALQKLLEEKFQCTVVN